MQTRWKAFCKGIGICLLFNVSSAAASLFYSQASQDHFVNLMLHAMIDKPSPGYYLEIGAGHPIHLNNTYYLEKKLGWSGFCIYISDACKAEWYTTRNNELIVEDATQADYSFILKDFPSVIDYLSLDIDDQYDLVLKKIPFDRYVFKVITIEHDFYRFGDKFRNKEREILSSLGYFCLCPDTGLTDLPWGEADWPYGTAGNWPFEDWWIYPDAFSAEMVSKLISLDLTGKSHRYVIEKIFQLLKL